MKQITTALQKISFGQILATALVSLTLLVSIVLGQFGDDLSVQAATMTPEASRYQIDRSNTEVRINPEQIKDQAEATGGGLLDTVREKLNLDEPLPEGTKAFFKQVRGEDVEVQEQIPSGKGEEPLNE
ncbi:hypothetical protein ACN4EK_07470 [Pantanalinema rosaneae CENA516]|uniref:hypothetical protein n=1 Tax=Pantanalinema rosaneae TaxID=1620701 RepID=UPI003D6E198C